MSERDAGMTLPELLVALVVMGMLGVVVSSTIQVAFVSRQGSQARTNVARFEQALDMQLPNDLASAAEVSTDPAATACPSACPANVAALAAGSNALLLTWVGVDEQRRVSYVFAPSGSAYALSRVECRAPTATTNWTCTSSIVLRDLSGPPGGQIFEPGVTVPDWVLQVSAPLAADATSASQLATGTEVKDARRVVVTINGGGTAAGSGGGSNQISITAGGTTRGVLAPNDVVNAPTFATTHSRCGGRITLIVDESGSIGSAMTSVEAGVTAFVEAFAGTPTQLQIINFDTTSAVLGAGSAWNRYFDLSDSAETNELLAAIPSLNAYGGTNWEDAWFRSIFLPDGTLQASLPEMVVFFTDGRPTYERIRFRASPGIVPAQPPLPGPGWPTDKYGNYSNGFSFTQVGFNRTDWIVDQLRSNTRIIGVGVGSITTGTSEWIDNPGAGYHLTYERGYRMYLQRVGSNWVWINEATYTAGNTTADDTDGYREVAKQYVTSDADAQDWEPTAEARTDGGYRSVAVYTPPYDFYDAPVSVTTSDKVILSRLISGTDHAVEANWNADESRFDNAETAELYSLDNIDKFGEALRSVALAECGGTVSVSTHLDSGGRAPVPFELQNTQVTRLDGTPMEVPPTVVQVNPTFPVGTFDFPVPAAQSLLVDILPGNTAAMANYAPKTANPWTCRAGVNSRAYTPVPVAGSDWVGARVQIGANEAVSCTLEIVAR